MVAPVLLAGWWHKGGQKSLAVGIMVQSSYIGWLLACKFVPMICQSSEPGMIRVANGVGAFAVVNFLSLGLYRRPTQAFLDSVEAAHEREVNKKKTPSLNRGV